MQMFVRSHKNIVFADSLFRWRFFLLLLVALIGFSVSTFAQQATIVGTVTDPSGAVVPNVNVTVTNTATGASRVYPTNDAGQYVAPDLQIGHYSVKANAAGFKVAEQKDIVLTVGDRIRVDFQMQMGAAQETVTVEADAVHVQADSGEQSNLITDQQVSQLAVNGRGVQWLAALTPGASSNITGFVNTPVGGDFGVEFNGQRENHNIWLLDGGENDDRGGAGGMSIAPSSDAIAEFRALTSNYSADYGLSSAATMTMVLKSGGSTLHASAWEFNRNDSFDARNFFFPRENPNGSINKIPELRYNTWGFNVGGPVTFGHLYNPDKKRTFFFYNMEWRRYVFGGQTNQTVPDPATEAGDFSALLTPTGGAKPTILYVPTTSQVSSSVLFANCPGGAPAGITQGSPFPNNKIPACMLNPNAQAFLKAGVFPAPTTGIANGQGTFLGGANAPTNLKEEIVRIDHNFTSKFSVFGHFVAEQITQNYAISQWSGDNVPTVGDTFGNPSFSGVVHTTYTISPTLINEVAFNYNGNRINIIPYAATGLGSLALPSCTGGNAGAATAPCNFANSRLFTGPNNLGRIPNLDISGIANFEISSWPWRNKADDYQIRDDVSWTKGAHQFKIGGSWAIYKKIQDLFGQTQGGFSFNGQYTGTTAAVNPACFGTNPTEVCGSSFADYLLGTPNSYQELAVQDRGYWNNVSTALWFQDNWRVNHRLTLNLGLRWDGVPHTYEANDRMGNFYPNLYKSQNTPAKFDSANNICNQADVTAGDPLCPTVSPGLGTSPNSILQGVNLYLAGIGIPGHNGIPKGLVNNHWAAFGPRLGFAYDLTGNGKTVVRGGFGIMYERIQGNDMYNAGSNIPFSLQVNVNGVEMTNPSTALSNGVSTPASALPIHAASITGLAIDNYKLPSSSQWSLGVQHALSTKTVLSVSYVGNVSRHQNDYRQINLPAEANLGALLTANAPYQTSCAPSLNPTTCGLPYPGFTNINLAENEANTHYNSLQVDLNSQLTKDLNLRAFYTLARAVDPSTGGNGGSDLQGVSNPYAGWAYDQGLSGFNRTHVGVVDFIYDVPLLRHSDNKFLKNVVAGWEVSGIITAESGFPLNLHLTNNQGGNFVGGNNRPDQVGPTGYQQTAVTCTPACGQQIQYFNAGSFVNPTLGAWGTLAHNALTGPGRDNWNLSLFKSFLLSETRGSKLELRLETFNTWNHTQFQNVDTGVGDSKFGQFTSAFDPRIIQLGGKIYF